MADFYIGEGDTASTMLVTMRDAAGAAVNCTGASAVVDVTPIHGGTKIVNAAAATPVDLPNGQFSYTFTAPQTVAGAAVGDALAKFTVTFGGGAIESFPNAGYFLITFGPDAPTTAQEYASVEELKKTANLTGTTYADQDIKLALSAASTAINIHCGRVFTLGTSETRNYYTVSSDYLLIDDATTVTAVVANAVTLTLTTDYYLEPVRVAKPGPPYDVLRANPTNRMPGYGPFGMSSTWGPVAVTGTFGWPSVPTTIKMATMILASRYVQRARSAPFAILSFGDGGEAARLTRSDPDVAMLLSPYTRSGMIE
jgi:hypothetical protein